MARHSFERGLVCSPHHVLITEKLVEVLLRIGDYDAAAVIAAYLLKIHPGHPRASQLLACLQSLGKPCSAAQRHDLLLLAPSFLVDFWGYVISLMAAKLGARSLAYALKQNVDFSGATEGSAPQSSQLPAVDEERVFGLLTPRFPKRMRSNVTRTSEAENDASPPAVLDLAELSWEAFLAALVATLKGGSGHQQLLQVRQPLCACHHVRANHWIRS